ncbi:KR domain-containing protein, partial [Streptomyces sp. NPDC020800]|uniref:beta-ketoacyl reductase n=1 Tax=Streptomyces sp. NPDC020800 TaxID=3365092 RepID=UPI0037B268F7
TPCDLTNPHQLTNLLNNIPTQHPLTTLIHTAATLDDATLTNLTPTQLNNVLATKAHTAQLLHHHTLNTPLQHFILYSSAAATLGSPGQANYAAANAHLDALAHHRHTHGLPATTIAWGTWQGNGLSSGDIGEHLRRRGMIPMDPKSAVRVFDLALASGRPSVFAADIDWLTFSRNSSPGLRTLFEDIPEAQQPETTPAGSADRLSESEKLPALLARQAPAEQFDTLLALVRARAANVLGRDQADSVAAERPFRELGFDSLSAVEIRNHLASDSGLVLPTTLVFDHPTPAKLAAFLRVQLVGAVPDGAPAVPAPRSEADEPIAIVGMACRFPGGVTSPQQLWDLIASQQEAIGPFPTDRGWDLDHLYHPDPDHPGTTCTRHGGFLYDAGEFDADFFGINPREALAMDPQ